MDNTLSFTVSLRAIDSGKLLADAVFLQAVTKA